MKIRTEYQCNPVKSTYGPIWREFNPLQTLWIPSPPVTKVTMADGHSILVRAGNQRNHQWRHFVVFHSQSCVNSIVEFEVIKQELVRIVFI